MKIGRASPTDFQNKIPAITAGFWIMKITATTLGETAGDGRVPRLVGNGNLKKRGEVSKMVVAKTNHQ